MQKLESGNSDLWGWRHAETGIGKPWLQGWRRAWCEPQNIHSHWSSRLGPMLLKLRCFVDFLNHSALSENLYVLIFFKMMLRKRRKVLDILQNMYLFYEYSRCFWIWFFECRCWLTMFYLDMYILFISCMVYVNMVFVVFYRKFSWFQFKWCVIEHHILCFLILRVEDPC